MSSGFILFGKYHLAALGVIIVASIVIPQIMKRYQGSTIEWRFRLGLAAAIWLQEITLNIYRISTNTWNAQTSLALHLCGMSVVVLPIMLYYKNYALYELVYFWGLGGATQALLTPDLVVTFPRFLYFQFFTSHGLIILAVIYATVVFGFRPTLRSGVKAFFVTVALMVPIGLINWILGSNYFFISHKPDTPSVLDFMGPWPVYLLGMIGLGALIFFLVWLPIPLIRRREQ